MKRIIVPIVLALVASLGPSAAHAEGPVVVGLDELGDWGANVDTTLGPVGHELGGDFMSASIDNDTPGLVKFIMGMTNLPESGGVPEFMRYLWVSRVGGKYVELDGKFSNYHRGTCDPTSGQCPPARDPGPQPFIVKTNCESNGAATICQEVGIVKATFDPASATITIPVPLSLLGFTSCANITPAVNTNSFPNGNLVAIPSAWFSQAAMPTDYLVFDDEMDVEVC